MLQAKRGLDAAPVGLRLPGGLAVWPDVAQEQATPFFNDNRLAGSATGRAGHVVAPHAWARPAAAQHTVAPAGRVVVGVEGLALVRADDAPLLPRGLRRVSTFLAAIGGRGDSGWRRGLAGLRGPDGQREAPRYAAAPCLWARRAVSAVV